MSKTPSSLTQSPTEQVLQQLVFACQIQARLTDQFTLCAHGEESAPDASFAWFHLVEQGSCLIRSPTQNGDLLLQAGDLVVFPCGASHRLLSAAPHSENAECALLCGEFHFSGRQSSLLRAALPRCLHIPASNSGLSTVAGLIRAELRHPSIGSGALINKLCDLLFVIAVRHHLMHSARLEGLLAALTDPRLCPALAQLHQHPGRAWTVEALARAAHLSRAGFAQRFKDLLGMPPMRYLAECRMHLAEQKLHDPNLGVAQLAGELGYETEAAFRRAYKRVHGHSPGAARKGRAAK